MTTLYCRAQSSTLIRFSLMFENKTHFTSIRLPVVVVICNFTAWVRYITPFAVNMGSGLDNRVAFLGMSLIIDMWATESKLNLPYPFLSVDYSSMPLFFCCLVRLERLCPPLCYLLRPTTRLERWSEPCLCDHPWFLSPICPIVWSIAFNIARYISSGFL